jgi:hypothetical protein
MSTRANLRYNARTKTFHPRQINNEEHIVELVGGEEIGGPETYGFFPDEMPWKETPSEIVLEFTDSAGGTAQEVPLGAAVNQNQFSIDYPHLSESDEFSGTGFIYMNENDLDRPFVISYKGIGTNNLSQFRKLSDFTIIGDLFVEGSIQSVKGNVNAAPYTVMSGETVLEGYGLEFIRKSVRHGQGQTDEYTSADKSVNSAATMESKKIRLNDEKSLIIYVESGAGKCLICETDIDGNNTYGSTITFNASGTAGISADVFDETKFVIVFTDGSNSSYGTCILGTVSGNTISLGSAVVFKSASTSYKDISVMSSSLIAVTYGLAGTVNTKMVCASISGTVPTFNTAGEYSLFGNLSPVSTDRVSNTTGIIASGLTGPYTGITVYYFLIVGTAVVSHTTKTVQRIYLTPYFIFIKYLSEGKFVLAYDCSTIAMSKAFFIQLGCVYATGETPVLSRPQIVKSQNGNAIGATLIKFSQKLVGFAFADIDDGNKGKIYFYSVESSGLQFLKKSTFDSGSIEDVTGVALYNTRAIIDFRNNSDSGKLYNRVIDFSEFVGVALYDANSNEEVHAGFDGLIYLQNSILETNKEFFIDSTGQLTNSPDRLYLGISVASNLIKRQRQEKFIYNNRNLVGAKYRAHGHAGYGSTNNKIPYWSGIQNEDLSSINTISNSSSLGWSMTVLVPGVYSVNYLTFAAAGSGVNAGASINSSQLSTTITGINQADRALISVQTVAGERLPVTGVVLLKFSDVFRLHTDGAVPNNTTQPTLEIILIALTEEF